MSRKISWYIRRGMATFAVGWRPSPWDRDLSHLEGDIATMVHHLRADLDELLLQARQ
jgi:hypothetical protein